MSNENQKLSTFESEDKEYAIMKATAQVGEDAHMEYTRMFSKVLAAGGLLQAKLDDYMKKQGYWNDEKEKEYLDLLRQLNDEELKLSKGNIKLSEAKRVALNMKDIRNSIADLLMKRRELHMQTVEGQSEQSKFNYLLVHCLVYNDTGEKVYKDVYDYLNRQNETLAFISATKFADVYYGLDEEYDQRLPENVFLKKWKFADDKLRLINSEGKFVDEEGRLIDKDSGLLVDEDGDFIDVDGNKITEEGLYNTEPKPFLDEDGNPLPDPNAPAEEVKVEENVKEPQAKEKPKKRKRVQRAKPKEPVSG